MEVFTWFVSLFWLFIFGYVFGSDLYPIHGYVNVPVSDLMDFSKIIETDDRPLKTRSTDSMIVKITHCDESGKDLGQLTSTINNFCVKYSKFPSSLEELSVVFTCTTCKNQTYRTRILIREGDDSLDEISGTYHVSKSNFGFTSDIYGEIYISAAANYKLNSGEMGRTNASLNLYVLGVKNITGKIIRRIDDIVDLQFNITYNSNTFEHSLKKSLKINNTDNLLQLMCTNNICTYSGYSLPEDNNRTYSIRFEKEKSEGTIEHGVHYESCFEDFTVESSKDIIQINPEPCGLSVNLENPVAYLMKGKNGEKISPEKTISRSSTGYLVSGLVWNIEDGYDILCVKSGTITICKTALSEIKPIIKSITINNLQSFKCPNGNADTYVTYFTEERKRVRFVIEVESLARFLTNYIYITYNDDKDKFSCSVNSGGSITTNEVICDVDILKSFSNYTFKFGDFDSKTVIISNDSVEKDSLMCTITGKRCVYMDNIYDHYTPEDYTKPKFEDTHTLIIGDPKKISFTIKHVKSRYGIKSIRVDVLNKVGMKNYNIVPTCEDANQVLKFDLMELIPDLVLVERGISEMKVTIYSYSGKSISETVYLLKNPQPKVDLIYGWATYNVNHSDCMWSKFGFIKRDLPVEGLSYEINNYYKHNIFNPKWADTSVQYGLDLPQGGYSDNKLYDKIAVELDYNNVHKQYYVDAEYTYKGGVLGISYEPTVNIIGMDDFTVVQTTANDNSSLIITARRSNTNFYSREPQRRRPAFMKLDEERTWVQCSDYGEDKFLCPLRYQTINWNGYVEFTCDYGTIGKSFDYSNFDRVYPPITGVELVPINDNYVSNWVYSNSTYIVRIILRNNTTFFPGKVKVYIRVDSSENNTTLDVVKATNYSNERYTNEFVFKNVYGGYMVEKQGGNVIVENFPFCYDQSTQSCSRTLSFPFRINNKKPQIEEYTPPLGTRKANFELYIDGNNRRNEEYQFCGHRYKSTRDVLVTTDINILLNKWVSMGPFKNNTTGYFIFNVTNESNESSYPTGYIKVRNKEEYSCYCCDFDNGTDCDCCHCSYTCDHDEEGHPISCCTCIVNHMGSHHYSSVRIGDIIPSPEAGVVYSLSAKPYGESKKPADDTDIRKNSFVWFKGLSFYMAETGIEYTTNSKTCGYIVFWVKTNPTTSVTGKVTGVYKYFDSSDDLDVKERVFSTTDLEFSNSTGRYPDPLYTIYRRSELPSYYSKSYYVGYSLKGRCDSARTTVCNYFTDFSTDIVGREIRIGIQGNLTCAPEPDRAYISFARTEISSECTRSGYTLKCRGFIIPLSIQNKITAVIHPVYITKDEPGLVETLKGRFDHITKTMLNEKETPTTVYVTKQDSLRFSFSVPEQNLYKVQFNYTYNIVGNGTNTTYSVYFNGTDTNSSREINATFNNITDFLKMDPKIGDRIKVRFSNPVIQFARIETTTYGDFDIIVDGIAPECRENLGGVGPFETCIYFTGTLDNFKEDREMRNSSVHENVIDGNEIPKLVVGPLTFRPGALERIELEIYDENNDFVSPISNESWIFEPREFLDTLSFGNVNYDIGGSGLIELTNEAYLLNISKIGLNRLEKGVKYTLKVYGRSKSGVRSDGNNGAMRLDFIIKSEIVTVEHFFRSVDLSNEVHILSLYGVPKVSVTNNNNVPSGKKSKAYISEIYCGNTTTYTNPALTNDGYYSFDFSLGCRDESIIKTKVGYYQGDITDPDGVKFFRGLLSYDSNDITNFKNFVLEGKVDDLGHNILNANIICREGTGRCQTNNLARIMFISNGYNEDRWTDCSKNPGSGVTPDNISCKGLYVTSTWEDIVSIDFRGTKIINRIKPALISNVLPYVDGSQASINNETNIPGNFFYANNITMLEFNLPLVGKAVEYPQGFWIDIFKYDVYQYTQTEINNEGRTPYARVVSLSVKEKTPEEPTKEPVEKLSINLIGITISGLIASSIEYNGLTNIKTDGDYEVIIRNISTVSGNRDIKFLLRIDNIPPNCINPTEGGRCIFTSEPYKNFMARYDQPEDIIYDQIYEESQRMVVILGPFRVLNEQNAGTVYISVEPEKGYIDPNYELIDYTNYLTKNDLIDEEPAEVEQGNTNNDSGTSFNPVFENNNEDNSLLMYYYLDVSSKFRDKLLRGAKYYMEALIKTRCGVESEDRIYVKFIIRPHVNLDHYFSLIDNVNQFKAIEFYVSANITGMKETNPNEDYRVNTWIKKIKVDQKQEFDIVNKYDKEKSKDNAVIVYGECDVDSYMELTLGFYEDIKGNVTLTSTNINSLNNFNLTSLKNGEEISIKADLTCSNNFQACSSRMSRKTGEDVKKIMFIDDDYDSICSSGNNEINPEYYNCKIEKLKNGENDCDVLSDTSLACKKIDISHKWWNFVAIKIGDTIVVNEVDSPAFDDSIPYISQITLNGVESGQNFVYVSSEQSLSFEFNWSGKSNIIIGSLKALMSRLGNGQGEKELVINTKNGDEELTRTTSYRYETFSKFYKGQDGEDDEDDEDGVYDLRIRNTPTKSTDREYLTFKLLKIDRKPECVNKNDEIGNCINILNNLDDLYSQEESASTKRFSQIINDLENLHISLGPFSNYHYKINEDEDLRYEDLNIEYINFAIKLGDSLIEEGEINRTEIQGIRVDENDIYSDNNIKEFSVLIKLDKYVTKLVSNNIYNFIFKIRTKAGVTSDSISRLFMIKPNLNVSHKFNVVNLVPKDDDDDIDVPNQYEYTISNGPNRMGTLCSKIMYPQINNNVEENCKTSETHKFGSYSVDRDGEVLNLVRISYDGINGNLSYNSTDNTRFSGLEVEAFTNNEEKYPKLLINLSCINSQNCDQMDGAGLVEFVSESYIEDTEIPYNCHIHSGSSYICKDLIVDSDWNGIISFRNSEIQMILRTDPTKYSSILSYIINVTLDLDKYDDVYYTNSLKEIKFTFTLKNDSKEFIRNVKFGVYRENETELSELNSGRLELYSDNKNEEIKQNLNAVLNLPQNILNDSEEHNERYVIKIKNMITAPSDNSEFSILVHFDNRKVECLDDENNTCMEFQNIVDNGDNIESQLLFDRNEVNIVLGPLKNANENIVKEIILDVAPKSIYNDIEANLQKVIIFSNDIVVNGEDDSIFYRLDNPFDDMQLLRGVIYDINITINTKSNVSSVINGQFLINPEVIINHWFVEIDKTIAETSNRLVIDFSTEIAFPLENDYGCKPVPEIDSANCGDNILISDGNSPNRFSGTCGNSDEIIVKLRYLEISGIQTIRSENITVLGDFDIIADSYNSSQPDPYSSLRVTLTYFNNINDSSGVDGGETMPLVFFGPDRNDVDEISAQCSKIQGTAFRCRRLNVPYDWDGLIRLNYRNTIVLKNFDPRALANIISYSTEISFNGKSYSEPIPLDPATPIRIVLNMALPSTESIEGVSAVLYLYKNEEIISNEMVVMEFDEDDQNIGPKNEKTISYANLGELINIVETGEKVIKYKLVINNIPTSPNVPEDSGFMIEYKQYSFNCLEMEEEHSCLNISTDFTDFENKIKNNDGLYGGIIDQNDNLKAKLYLAIGPILNDSQMIMGASIILNDENDESLRMLDESIIHQYESNDETLENYVYLIIDITGLKNKLVEKPNNKMTVYIIPKYNVEKVTENNKVGDLYTLYVGSIGVEYNFLKITNLSREDNTNKVKFEFKGQNENCLMIRPIIHSLYCNERQDEKLEPVSDESNTYISSCDPTDTIEINIKYEYYTETSSFIPIVGRRKVTGRYLDGITGIKISGTQGRDPFKLNFDIKCKGTSMCGTSIPESKGIRFYLSEDENNAQDITSSCERVVNSFICENFGIGYDWERVFVIKTSGIHIINGYTDDSVSEFYDIMPKFEEFLINGNNSLKKFDLIEYEPITIDIRYDDKTTIWYTQFKTIWNISRKEDSDNRIIEGSKIINITEPYVEIQDGIDSLTLTFNSILEILLENKESASLEPNNTLNLNILTPGENSIQDSRISFEINLMPLSTECENLSADNGDQCLYFVDKDEKLDENREYPVNKIIFKESIGDMKLIVGKYINSIVAVEEFNLKLSVDEEIYNTNVPVSASNENNNLYEIDIPTEMIYKFALGEYNNIEVTPIFVNNAKTSGDVVSRLSFYYAGGLEVKYTVKKIDINDGAVYITAEVSASAPITINNYYQDNITDEGYSLRCIIEQTNMAQGTMIIENCNPRRGINVSYSFIYNDNGEFNAVCERNIELVDLDLLFAEDNNSKVLMIETMGVDNKNVSDMISSIDIQYQQNGQNGNIENISHCEKNDDKFKCNMITPDDEWDGELHVYVKYKLDGMNYSTFEYIYGSYEEICPWLPTLIGSSVHGMKTNSTIPLFRNIDENDSDYPIELILEFDSNIAGDYDPVVYYIDDNINKDIESSPIKLQGQNDETERDKYLLKLSYPESSFAEEGGDAIDLVLLGIKPTSCYELVPDTNSFEHYKLVKGVIDEGSLEKNVCLLKTIDEGYDDILSECVVGYNGESFGSLGIILNTNDIVNHVILSNKNGEDDEAETELCRFDKEKIIFSNANGLVKLDLENPSEGNCDKLISLGDDHIKLIIDISTKCGGRKTIETTLYKFTNDPIITNMYTLDKPKGEDGSDAYEPHYLINYENGNIEINFEGCFENTTILKPILRNITNGNNNLEYQEEQQDYIIELAGQSDYIYYEAKKMNVNLANRDISSGIYKLELIPGNSGTGFNDRFYDDKPTPIIYYDGKDIIEKWQLYLSDSILDDGQKLGLLNSTVESNDKLNPSGMVILYFLGMKTGIGYSGIAEVNVDICKSGNRDEVLTTYNDSFKFEDVSKRSEIIGFLMKFDPQQADTLDFNIVLTNYNNNTFNSTVTVSVAKNEVVENKTDIDPKFMETNLLVFNEQVNSLSFVDKNKILAETNEPLREYYSYYDCSGLKLLVNIIDETLPGDKKTKRTYSTDPLVPKVMSEDQTSPEEESLKDYLDEGGKYLLEYSYESGGISNNWKWNVRYNNVSCKEYFNPLANRCETCSAFKTPSKYYYECETDNVAVYSTLGGVLVGIVAIVTAICLVVLRKRIFKREKPSDLYVDLDEDPQLTNDYREIYEYIPDSNTGYPTIHESTGQNFGIKELESSVAVESRDYTRGTYSWTSHGGSNAPQDIYGGGTSTCNEYHSGYGYSNGASCYDDPNVIIDGGGYSSQELQ